MAVLTTEQLAEGLKALPEWRADGEAIVRQYEFDGGFMGSVGFVNRLAAAAEVADHHPDLAISWNKVTVTFSTHSEGGVTEKDLQMAAEADRLAA
jgi:4a-hydroxytetrahydrobiopterin dehydratase